MTHEKFEELIKCLEHVAKPRYFCLPKTVTSHKVCRVLVTCVLLCLSFAHAIPTCTVAKQTKYKYVKVAFFLQHYTVNNQENAMWYTF